MTRKTKDQLSKSLYLLLQEYPFDNITVNQIINHSHISRTTFYRHFHNKQDVLTYFFHNDIVPQFFPSLLNAAVKPAVQLSAAWNIPDTRFLLYTS